jgi:site-specific DNA-methyltransferase (adenine-specific)
MNPETIKTFRVYNEDCLEAMSRLGPNSIDTIITDPPYGLKFMGKGWDHGIPGVPFWEAALRVAKPGAMLMAFGGTRTYHRLACAIEDAGWELRDCVMWVYGSGFPKSHNISKAIDKAAGEKGEVIGSKPIAYPDSNCWGTPCKNVMDKVPKNTILGKEKRTIREKQAIIAPATEDAKLWEGFGTSLKPAFEPIVLAMKPLDGTFAQNALKWGVAGLWIDGCRVDAPECPKEAVFSEGANSRYVGRYNQGVVSSSEPRTTSATGFPETSSGGGNKANKVPLGRKSQVMETIDRGQIWAPDSGSAARFFYCAKASKRERNEGLEGLPDRVGGSLEFRNRESGKGQFDGPTNVPTKNSHPTVKPIALLGYLCKLTATPTGGIVFDPFMGSGSTGVACAKVGRRFLGCDNDKEHGYFKIALKRIQNAYAKTTKKLPSGS